jgi:hypothetical protein
MRYGCSHHRMRSYARRGCAHSRSWCDMRRGCLRSGTGRRHMRSRCARSRVWCDMRHGCPHGGTGRNMRGWSSGWPARGLNGGGLPLRVIRPLCLPLHDKQRRYRKKHGQSHRQTACSDCHDKASAVRNTEHLSTNAPGFTNPTDDYVNVIWEWSSLDCIDLPQNRAHSRILRRKN